MNINAVEGGSMGVNQRTAQQAPVVVNAYWKPYSETTEAEHVQRCRTGLEDFGDGHPVFVATDPAHTAPSEEEKELADLGAYSGGDEEAGAAIFASIDKLFWDLYQQALARGSVAPEKEVVEAVYTMIRFFGFSDTTLSLQNNHSRWAQGSFRVTVRVGGDKTTKNLGPFRMKPGHDVVWFMPYDPTLKSVMSGKMYPRLTVPRLGEFQWRPIFMPLTKALVEADVAEHGTPLCLSRFVGRVLKPAEPNAPLTLNISTRPTSCPPGLTTALTAFAKSGIGGGGAGGVSGLGSSALFGDPLRPVLYRPVFVTEPTSLAPILPLVPNIVHAVAGETKSALSPTLLQGIMNNETLWGIYTTHAPISGELSKIQAVVKKEVNAMVAAIPVPPGSAPGSAYDAKMQSAIEGAVENAVRDGHMKNVILNNAMVQRTADAVAGTPVTAAGPGHAHSRAHAHAHAGPPPSSSRNDDEDMLFEDDV